MRACAPPGSTEPAGASVRRLGLVVLLLLAPACAREYETFEPPPLDFSDRRPVRLEVGEVTVRSAFRSQGAPPFVEHTFVLTPEAAVRQLLEQRLQAVGGPGSVQAVIVDAAVREEQLETTGGLRGYLTEEPSARLRGRLKVRIDRLDETGSVISSASTGVTRTRTIPEDAPYVRRQEIGYELVRDLVDDLDVGMVSNVRETFISIVEG